MGKCWHPGCAIGLSILLYVHYVVVLINVLLKKLARIEGGMVGKSSSLSPTLSSRPP